MSDLDIEEKIAHFSQAGMLGDPTLSQLRDQIKKVMIPILIKIFQFKLDLSKVTQNPKNSPAAETIIEQLKILDNDLKVLFLWCQSSRKQIHKALSISEEEKKNTLSFTSSSLHNPQVEKSFQHAVFAENSFFQESAYEEEKECLATASSQKTWWDKFLGH